MPTQKNKLLVIGLTGGIASGKSTAEKIFVSLGVPVLDADQIARELLTPPSPFIEIVKQHFGHMILNAAGDIDRALLRDTIFESVDARQWLEQLLHPIILERLKIQLSKIDPILTPYCIVTIPLLLESGCCMDFIDRVLVIDVPETLQKARLKSRSGLSNQQIDAILRTQVSRETRLAAADDLLENTRSHASLAKQIKVLGAVYISLGRGAAH